MGYNLLAKRKGIIIIVLLSVIVAGLLPALPAQAEGGIAISGSFYRHHFKMLPGESISSPQINIVVYNNYSRAIEVDLKADVPRGVAMDLDGKRLSIPGNSSKTFPVALSLAENIVPGEYEISISADVVPEKTGGISITGSAQLVTKLSVFGEAGWVNIETKTIDGQPFGGKLYLYLKEDGKLSPAGYSENGSLRERVIPGNYLAQVFWEGTEVAGKEFTVAANEEKYITLIAQTVFIQGFTAVPQYDGGKISSARLVYTVKNVYRPLKDVRGELNVYYRGKLLEKLDMFNLSTLDVGSQDGKYTYIPPKGWKNGEYRFRIDLYAEGDVLYAQSREQEIKVSAGLPTFFWYFGLAVLLLVLWLVFRKRRKCPDCKGKGVLDCPHCNGQGSLQEGSEKCLDCNGSGLIKCRRCAKDTNKKQKAAPFRRKSD